MPNEERLGASFSIDVTNLKSGLAQANRLIRESNSEFKAAAAGLDDWSNSEEGLTASLKNLNNVQDLQKKKVDALQKEYDRLISEGLDPASASAIRLRTDINKEKESLAKTEKQIREQTTALESLSDGSSEAGREIKEMGDDAEKASGKLEKLKTVGGGITKVLGGVVGACTAAIGGFLGLGESTKETQTQFAKLEQSFSKFDDGAGGVEYATDTLYGLQGVIGDLDRSVEASNLLAKMSKDGDDLAENTRILTGVFAEFGDSIPTEGLAEGMQATAEMGEVQGVLADALEWQGINLDDYNAKLQTMSSSEERAAYIQKTLSDIYGKSADTYRENNKALIESNEAQLRLETQLSEVGQLALPIMTELKNLISDLLLDLSPFIELIGEGLSGALLGTEGATEKLADGLSGIISTILEKIVGLLPMVISTIVAVVPTLADSLLQQLPAILDVILLSVTQITNAITEMLPQIIDTIMQILPNLINSLIDAAPQLLEASIQLLMAIVDSLPTIINSLIIALPGLIHTITKTLTANIPLIITAAITLFMGIIKAIPSILTELKKSLPKIISGIVSGLSAGLPDIIDTGKNLIRGLWQGISDMTQWIKDKIKGFGSDILDGLKDFFGIHSPSTVMEDIIGKNLALGIGEGFADNIDGVNKEIQSSINIDGVKVSTGTSGTVPAAVAGGRSVVINQTNNYSSPHSQYELYKTKQKTVQTVKQVLQGG